MFDFNKQGQELKIVLSGDVYQFDNRQQIDDLLFEIHGVKKIFFEVKELEKWDSTLITVLYDVFLEAKKYGIDIDWQQIPQNIYKLISLALEVDRKPQIDHFKKVSFFYQLGDWGVRTYNSVKNSCLFLKDVLFSFGRLFKGKAVMRTIDFEFALEDCSYKAVGIVSLVSFMVGLILAFVGALQLKLFGAQIYIASLVTIAMIRIMGAIMAGIIIAGRTGASYAATIGTMQVNEEIDALKTFGFSVSDFLVLPRVLSLIITMPFLTMIADIMGMIGGAFVAVLMLDISAIQYWQYSLNAFGMTNFLVGIFHGFIYGIIVSCCGCYYGVNCDRNADGVGKATTKAVVSSIVMMIVITGILTFVFQMVGL